MCVNHDITVSVFPLSFCDPDLQDIRRFFAPSKPAPPKAPSDSGIRTDEEQKLIKKKSVSKVFFASCIKLELKSTSIINVKVTFVCVFVCFVF